MTHSQMCSTSREKSLHSANFLEWGKVKENARKEGQKEKSGFHYVAD